MLMHRSRKSTEIVKDSKKIQCSSSSKLRVDLISQRGAVFLTIRRCSTNLISKAFFLNLSAIMKPIIRSQRIQQIVRMAAGLFQNKESLSWQKKFEKSIRFMINFTDDICQQRNLSFSDWFMCSMIQLECLFISRQLLILFLQLTQHLIQ